MFEIVADDLGHGLRNDRGYGFEPGNLIAIPFDGREPIFLDAQLGKSALHTYGTVAQIDAPYFGGNAAGKNLVMRYFVRLDETELAEGASEEVGFAGRVHERASQDIIRVLQIRSKSGWQIMIPCRSTNSASTAAR